MNKKEYRIKNKELRKKISNKKQKDLDIFFECINDIDFVNSNVVALYYPINFEVNCIELIKYALNHSKIVCLPKINRGNRMDFIKITSLNELKDSVIYKLKEPIYNKDNIIDPLKIDVMFIPLLGFDNKNHRLGYGKGYYDTYLKDIDIKTIGLGYKELLIEEDIFIEHDIPLRKIICK